MNTSIYIRTKKIIEFLFHISTFIILIYLTSTSIHLRFFCYRLFYWLLHYLFIYTLLFCLLRSFLCRLFHLLLLSLLFFHSYLLHDSSLLVWRKRSKYFLSLFSLHFCFLSFLLICKVMHLLF